MVAFQEPETSIPIDKEIFDSPPETAVNTAVPSRVPSILLKETDVDDLENGIASEKLAEAEAQNELLFGCVDPVTYIVGWDGLDDPHNPMNFPRSKKWVITMSTALMTFVVSFSSSVFSTATTVTALEFGVSLEVMILGVSLYVLGFAFGSSPPYSSNPLLPSSFSYLTFSLLLGKSNTDDVLMYVGPLFWGPISEVYGRTRPIFIGFFIFSIFQIPVALAQNVYTIMICRFLAGSFGAAPISIVGGTYVDFWDALDRGIATAGFAGATFLGPIAGPIVGEFITRSDLGWRWTAWITLIMAAFFGTIGLFTFPETYAPVLLKRKAEKMRHETKNWAIHAQLDEQPIHVRSLFEKYFSKPWIMLAQEPIVSLLPPLFPSLIKKQR
jgi:DHA1 family multidrug resistance protein-like MFS transporter